jgi:hypothetical protein
MEPSLLVRKVVAAFEVKERKTIDEVTHRFQQAADVKQSAPEEVAKESVAVEEVAEAVMVTVAVPVTTELYVDQQGSVSLMHR